MFGIEEMKVAIIGASGKTGTKLVREALKRGYQVIAVCRDSVVITESLAQFDSPELSSVTCKDMPFSL